MVSDLVFDCVEEIENVGESLNDLVDDSATEWESYERENSDESVEESVIDTTFERDIVVDAVSETVLPFENVELCTLVRETLRDKDRASVCDALSVSVTLDEGLNDSENVSEGPVSVHSTERDSDCEELSVAVEEMSMDVDALVEDDTDALKLGDSVWDSCSVFVPTVSEVDVEGEMVKERDEDSSFENDSV